MSLNKQSGNMYPWVTHTWNPIRGRCPHECTYCYMKRFPLSPLHLDEKSLRDDLSKAKTIFVGSSTDMWAEEVPKEWLEKVLAKCSKESSRYLFQTKNPARFWDFRKFGLPSNAIYGTTIETTNEPLSLKISKAPSVWYRYADLADLNIPEKMVSIEPIMDFTVSTLLSWLLFIKPQFVSIGADSKGHNLPEPPAGKIKELIQELEKFTEVKIKDNLNRLLGNH